MINTEISFPSNTTNFLVLTQSIVHGYVAKRKSTLADGICQILEPVQSTPTQNSTTANDQKVYFIKVDTFFCVITNSTIFVRIIYPETRTYLFENSSGQLLSISFPKDTPNLDKFEQYFSHYSVILDFDSQFIGPELRNKIEQSCPEDIESKDVSIDAKSVIKKIGKNVGAVVETVSSYIQGPLATAGSKVGERADSFAHDSVKPETKSKWNGVVQKSKSINQTMSSAIRPAMHAYNNTVESVGQKFYNSNNSFIKTIREYSLAFASSLNEGKSKSNEKQESKQGQENQEYIEQNSQMQFK